MIERPHLLFQHHSQRALLFRFALPFLFGGLLSVSLRGQRPDGRVEGLACARAIDGGEDGDVHVQEPLDAKPGSENYCAFG